MSDVLAHVRGELLSRARALILGFPSGDGSKATGLRYSVEYFERESKNASRGAFHRTNAAVAFRVLSDPRLEEFIMGTLVPGHVEAVLSESLEKSPNIRSEEKTQVENDKKVAESAKVVAKVASAKKVTVKRTTTAAKKTTTVAAKKTTAKKAPAKKPAVVKSK